MATHRISMLNNSITLDSTGNVFPGRIADYDTYTNVKNQTALIFEYPTGADIAIEGNFPIPKNFVGNPKVICRGTFVGAPANTFGVGCQMLGVANSESCDQALEAEDLANEGTWTGYADEDFFEIAITMTVTLAAEDICFWKFFRDDSVDTQTQRFMMTDLLFQYDDV